MKPTAGLMINPNVRLLAPLGSGAMGAVWIAEHLTLHTRVAVKVISERLDPDDEEILTRFSREATTAAQIKSAHVVQTFDHGITADGTPYIVMELLDGEGLGERLDSEGPLPLDLCALVVLQAAKALHSAHKLGIVHRDIKPDNVFLARRDDELQVKIFDFGIAKQTRLPAMGGITCEDMMVGTPEYMSPEQVMSSKTVDHTADLWALAVVTYACLTGELPFQGEAIGELCINLLRGEYAAPSTLRPELPATVDRFFARALARSKADRFASARELAQAFLAALPSAALPQDALVTGRYAPLAEDDSFPTKPGPTKPEPATSENESARTPTPVTNGLRAPTLGGSATDHARAKRRSPLVWATGALIALVTFGVTLLALPGRGGEHQPAAATASIEAVVPPVAASPVSSLQSSAEDRRPETGDSSPLASASAAPSAAPKTAAKRARRSAPPRPAAPSPPAAGRNPGF